MRRRTSSADTRLIHRTMLRIGLQPAGAVLVAVVLLGAAVFLVILHTQQEQQNDQLATTIASADDVIDPPAGIWLVMRRDGRTAASPGLPDGLPDEAALEAVQTDGKSRTTGIEVRHGEYQVLTERRGDDVIQAALDLRTAHRGRSRLAIVLLVAGGAGLLLAGITGAWVARRAVTPLVNALALQRRFVADDGPGLDASVLPTLFTRFTQAPTDTPPGERRRYGLGLSLVSEIAARHNGSVSARNHDADGGAVLSLTLPVHPTR